MEIPYPDTDDAPLPDPPKETQPTQLPFWRIAADFQTGTGIFAEELGHPTKE